jgi:HemY protein
MIRVVLFLVLVGLLALGGAWLAERPGEVVITWLDLRIETSVLVAAAAIALVAALAIAMWSVIRFVLRSPDFVAMLLHNRRRSRGYRAISKGLIAVGAGDARAARTFASEAERLTPSEPLALLLNAQTAQLSGDRGRAEHVFRDMAARADTKLLGLRGLYVEAQRRDDPIAARQYVEEAVKASPALSWANQAVLEFRCAAADWAGALVTLESNRRSRLIDKLTYRRQRAVLLTARALAAADTNPAEGKALALQAVKLAPDLVPAAALAGRLLSEAGEVRKAAKILEAAWRANPHPDLADIYAHLKSGDSARDRLTRVQILARQSGANVEAMLAVARAAVDAQEFSTARAALAPLLAAPTQRVAMLMAELEEAEHGDEGRAREWMARAARAARVARDPAWTADGFVSELWMPVSPVTGRLDAFQWKVPVAEVGDTLEAERAPDLIEAAPGQTREATDIKPSFPEPAGELAAPRAASARVPARRVDAVIPLVHAPDDPGPEPERSPEPAANGRRGLRLFFR